MAKPDLDFDWLKVKGDTFDTVSHCLLTHPPQQVFRWYNGGRRQRGLGKDDSAWAKYFYSAPDLEQASKPGGLFWY